jgi:hypothetical protein
VAAGFVDFEITWQADVFSGAPQSSSAAEFGTQGINFHARKAADEQEWHAARARLSCEVPSSPRQCWVPMPSQVQETKAKASLEMLLEVFDVK